jgi:hypothetical protein
LPDEFEHTGQIIDHVAIPKPDDAIPAPGNRARAGCVYLLLRCVLAAVEFDRKLEARAGEIDDVTADRMLAAKAVRTLQFTKSAPQTFLYLRRVTPQFAGNTSSRS